MTPVTSPGQPGPLKVLIAGAGVAGLEAAFALHALAADRVEVRLVAPTDEFVYRPMAVGEPFNLGEPQRYPLSELAERAGAELIGASVSAVDADRRVALTDSGAELPYDALLVALGTSSHRRYDHVTTVDDTRLDELLHGLVQDVEEGYVHRLAFIIPAPIPWPLPAYELALMTAERAWDMQAKIKVTIITPEGAPLEVFGARASQQVTELLAKRGIDVITSGSCNVLDAKTVLVHPGERRIEVDRIIALPELRGPALPGLPHDSAGFLAVDAYGRVTGAEAVWAVGDCTDYPVKQGGLAAQQADNAAQSIAARSGAGGPSQPFAPVLTGVLLTGDAPLRLDAGTDDNGTRSGLAGVIDASRVPKIAARYLGPYLAEKTTSQA